MIKARKYTFWLHPADREQALCIHELEAILEQIKNKDVRKGTLSRAIAKALYAYFLSQENNLPCVGREAKSDMIPGLPEQPKESKQPEVSTNGQVSDEAESEDGEDSDSIIDDLINIVEEPDV